MIKRNFLIGSRAVQALLYGPLRWTAEARFKRRTTTVPGWLDCSTASFQISNLIQSNLIAVPKQNTLPRLYELIQNKMY